VLQRGAVRCSVLQFGARWYSVVQSIAAIEATDKEITLPEITLATHFNSSLQHAATHCNTLQHAAPH